MVGLLPRYINTDFALSPLIDLDLIRPDDEALDVLVCLSLYYPIGHGGVGGTLETSEAENPQNVR